MRGRIGNSRGLMRTVLSVGGAIGLVAVSGLSAQASDDPVYDREWAMAAFHVQAIRGEFHAYGAGVVVGVVDSGIDSTQPDLQGQLVPGRNTAVPADPTSDTSDSSSDYHGTHVSSIIAAHGHGDPARLQGLVGLASRAKLMPLEDGGDSATNSSTAAAIIYGADHGVRVLNISQGVNGPCSQDQAQAIDYALAKNIVVVAAAGNDGNTSNASSCPANQPGVIDVAAIAQNGTMDSYSHYGRDVTVAAPGVNIEAAAPGGRYTRVRGTSDAAPWVAAEAALIIGLHPGWTAGQVIRVIIDKTVTGGGKRVDNHIGYGVIDPLKALGAPAPADKRDPLGGPLPGASVKLPEGYNKDGTFIGFIPPATRSASPGTPAGASPGNPPGKARSAGPYAAVGAGVMVLAGVIVLLVARGRKSGGRIGPGAGGYPGAGPAQGGHQPQSHRYPAPPLGHYRQNPQQSPQQYPPQAPRQFPPQPPNWQQQPGPYEQQPDPWQYPARSRGQHQEAPPPQQYPARPPHGRHTQ